MVLLKLVYYLFSFEFLTLYVHTLKKETEKVIVWKKKRKNKNM